MAGRATLLALLTVQAAAFTLVGLALWFLSGRPSAQFVTFDTFGFASGLALAGLLIALAAAAFYGLPKLSEYLVRVASHTESTSSLAFWVTRVHG